MKIEKFDKINLVEIRRSIDEALAPVNEKYGIELKLGNFRYATDGSSFRTQLDATIAGVGKKDYSEQYPWMKLPKIGTMFMSQGRKFKVTEHAPSRPKYPVIADDMVTGKRFKFQAPIAEASIVTE